GERGVEVVLPPRLPERLAGAERGGDGDDAGVGDVLRSGDQTERAEIEGRVRPRGQGRERAEAEAHDAGRHRPRAGHRAHVEEYNEALAAEAQRGSQAFAG